MTSRTLHLVDLENLAGSPRVSAGEAIETLHSYLDAAQWQPGDLVYVAMNPHLAERVAFDVAVPCRMHCAHGRDGADLALLAHAAPEFVARRATRLVIGSGDHIFLPRASGARDLGVDVRVVARADSVHWSWYSAGFPVVSLAPEALGQVRASHSRPEVSGRAPALAF